MRVDGRQRGVSLLEVLIALSIFALIGLASYRVLASVSQAQASLSRHSEQLQQWQRASAQLQADFESLVDRPVRRGVSLALAGGKPLQPYRPALLVAGGDSAGVDYPVEFSRAGWANPLGFPRSRLQRVAYDLGPHPQVDDPHSPYYQSQQRFLRRHYWTVLDREASEAAIIQPLLGDVENFSVAVISARGRHHQWPLNSKDGAQAVLGIELSIEQAALGKITLLYKVN